jgi:hypothetical protein
MRCVAQMCCLTSTTHSIPDLSRMAVVITTMHVLGRYYCLESHHEVFHSHRWYRIVLDEGHAMGRGASGQSVFSRHLPVAALGSPSAPLLSMENYGRRTAGAGCSCCRAR